METQVMYKPEIRPKNAVEHNLYLPVVGNSMYPRYCPGETVLAKRIFSFDTILWGEAYFVLTNENANNMRTIKCVHYCKDEDMLILRSCNPDYYGDTIIRKADILSMYIIKGKVSRSQL